jgi:hypothetical protein
MFDPQPAPLEDERAILRLQVLYTRAVDCYEPALIEEIFAEDALMERLEKRWEGRASMIGIPDMIRSKYLATRHCLTNQLVSVQGDLAEGQVYSTNDHIYRDDDGGYMNRMVGLRYDDRFARLAGRWRFTYRKLNVIWTKYEQVARL